MLGPATPAKCFPRRITLTYEYHCPKCEHAFDVIKSHRDIENPEHCPKCKEVSIRAFVPSRVYFIGTQVTHPEFNPGLGCIVKDKQHKKDLMKARGLEEVGNEPVEKIHKHFDKNREEKLDKAYDDSTKGWVGDGT